MPRAMILAAGLGTRLRPLTSELPKPLVPVGDRPVVAHIAAHLARAGILEAALNTHHLAEAFVSPWLGSLPLRLTVIHEPRILGTGGGIANAAGVLGGGDVIVWNGDILADLDVAALLEAHRRSAALATMAVASCLRGEGTVGLGAGGAVVRLRGERFGDEVSGGDFLGIVVMGAALRRRLPEVGCWIGDGVLPALREGGRISAFAWDGGFEDIGTLDAYLTANLRWLARQGIEAHVGEGACVSPGVVLSRAVVGASATVTGEGAIVRSVIWPGARAVAPLSGAVVTTRGQVVRLG